MLERYRNLVDENQHRVFTFACYYLGDRQEAEDVTQEVLLRLWRHLDKVDETTATAWLTKVTKNACFDALRKRQTRNRFFDESAEPETFERAPDGSARSDSSTAGWEIQRQLRKALRSLDEPYRSIVILREIQGHKYTEISDLLKMPLNTVKTYLHRARRKLREELREVYSYAQTS